MAGADGARAPRSAWRAPAAGRWRAARRRQHRRQTGEAVEHVARTLLRRYGVVFWRLLEREGGLAAAVARTAARLSPAGGTRRNPRRPFRRRIFRRAIRPAGGGRPAAGGSPQADSGAWISLSGADPLNLAGILTPGPRLAALTGNRLLYRDGLPIAVLAGGKVQFLETLEDTTNGRRATPCCDPPCPPS